MSPPRRHVLFVDDEPNVLSGLQRMLRPMRHEYSMHFANGGAEALATLAAGAFDVVVSDMRMPGIDGAALLDEVSRAHPHIVRIVLSGQADREAILRVVGPAHQYLSKPCDADELKTRLQQLFALHDLMHNGALRAQIGALRSLPSTPGLLNELTDELASDHASLGRIGRIVEQDVALTAKLLQIVSSAFFGVRRSIGSPEEAVRSLGLDLVRKLMLSPRLVSQIDPTAATRFRIAGAWRRAVALKRFVKVIGRLENASEEVTRHAVMAAALLDTGRLVLAACIPDEYGAIVDRAALEGTVLEELERDTLGCTNGEVGAYLLGLWGLPHQVSTVLAARHRSGVVGAQSGPTPLTLVLAAGTIARELLPEAARDDLAQAERDVPAAISAHCDYETWLRECAAVDDGEHRRPACEF